MRLSFALGFNTTPDTNFIDIFYQEPEVRDRPVPPVDFRTISGNLHMVGVPVIRLYIAGTYQTYLNDYINTVFGDFDTNNAELTLKVRDREGNMVDYNVIAESPHPRVHYTYEWYNEIRDLFLTFNVVNEATI